MHDYCQARKALVSEISHVNADQNRRAAHTRESSDSGSDARVKFSALAERLHINVNARLGCHQ